MENTELEHASEMTPKKRGPKTPKGKARAAMNAVKHGLRARRFLLLPEESPEEFSAFREAMLDVYCPGDAFEQQSVESIVIAMWREMRADRIEAEVMADIPPAQEGRGSGTDLVDKPEHRTSLATALRYRSQAQLELKRAVSMLEAHRRATGQLIPRAWASQFYTNEFIPLKRNDGVAANDDGNEIDEQKCTNEFEPAKVEPRPSEEGEPRKPFIYQSADPDDPDIVLPVRGLSPSMWPYMQAHADTSAAARGRAFRRLDNVHPYRWYQGAQAPKINPLE